MRNFASDDDEGSEGVDLKEVFIQHETKDALKVLLHDGRQVWIPKSQVHDDSDIWKKHEKGTLTIKSWFAGKEGLG